MIVSITLLAVTAASFSLLNVSGITAFGLRLHNLQPWSLRENADVIISSPSDWQRLSVGHCKLPSGNIALVELKSLCFTPTSEQLAKISTEFILVGPFYDWHHVNFGPLTEQEAGGAAGVLEARLSNKLRICRSERSPQHVVDLLNNIFLKHWVVHQHVRADVRHDKLAVLPLGFGYEDARIGDSERDELMAWKDMVIDVNRAAEVQRTPRDQLLLTSFQIHTSLFGDSGADPRTELLRNLTAIPSLQKYAEIRHFKSARDFATALRRYKFVLSPWGWGPDCFRHYEAIALGAIPITLSDWALDRALAKLPHLSVKRWSQLSESFLLAEHDRIHSGTYDWDRLLLDHWHDKLIFLPSAAQRVCSSL